MKNYYRVGMLLLLFGFCTHAQSQLLGLNYNSSQGAFQIVSIDPVTGATSVLNSNTGVGYASNLFISNPSAGVVYAAGTTGQIYTYNMTTGASVNSAQTSLSTIAGLTLGLNGNLEGLSSNLGTFQIVSINPITGATSVLNSNTGVSYASNIFISNPSAGVAYAAGTAGQVYTYDLITGTNVNTAQTSLTNIVSLTLGQNGKLEGLASNLGVFEIVSIDPITGTTSVLNSNTGVSYANNIFVSSPFASLVYAAGTTGQIYTYSLTTGDNTQSSQTNLTNVAIAALAVTTTVPEPSTWTLILLAFASVILLKWRRETRLAVCKPVPKV